MRDVTVHKATLSGDACFHLLSRHRVQVAFRCLDTTSRWHIPTRRALGKGVAFPLRLLNKVLQLRQCRGVHPLIVHVLGKVAQDGGGKCAEQH